MNSQLPAGTGQRPLIHWAMPVVPSTPCGYGPTRRGKDRHLWHQVNSLRVRANAPGTCWRPTAMSQLPAGTGQRPKSSVDP